MLATYMRRMRNTWRLGLRAPLVARKNFGGTTVSMIEITYEALLLFDIQSRFSRRLGESNYRTEGLFDREVRGHTLFGRE